MADEDARSVGDGSVNADFEHCADDERPNEVEMEQGADSQEPAPKKRSAPGAKKAERQLKVGDMHHADWQEEENFPGISIPPCTNETPSFGLLCILLLACARWAFWHAGHVVQAVDCPPGLPRTILH